MGPPFKVVTLGSGSLFGALALMYNAPRAATIQASENSKLFALNRETFNHVVKDAAMKKRNRYEAFLNKIPLTLHRKDSGRMLAKTGMNLGCSKTRMRMADSTQRL